MAQRDLKNATITLKDGGSNTLDVKIGEGTVDWSVKRAIQYVLDRGNLDLTKEGDQQPCELNIDAVWESTASSTGDPVTIEEFLYKLGSAGSFTSTGGDCEPDAVDVDISFDVTCGSVEDEVISFSEFRYESVDTDAKTGVLKIKGKCNIIRPTAVRTTLS